MSADRQALSSGVPAGIIFDRRLSSQVANFAPDFCTGKGAWFESIGFVTKFLTFVRRRLGWGNFRGR
jgi:hypothetical protein